MFRQVLTVVMVVLVAVGTLGTFGCSNQAETTKPGTETKDTGGQQPEVLPKERTFDVGKGIKLEMVLIPAGEFLMGSPDSDRDALNENPQHRVRITKPFYLGKYLVTQEQWQAVMGNNPSDCKGQKNPVEQVSWDDCQEFVGKLNAKSPREEPKFQLPTEAQWEYACRSGSTTRYCFGDNESGLTEYAWYLAKLGDETHPVGKKKPNAWGLYDMHGSVGEWCQDWSNDIFYAHSPVDDPPGPAMGSVHVIRGGDWLGRAAECRSASRQHGEPGSRCGFVGLRVALIPVDK